jgi:hypothetical protein
MPFNGKTPVIWRPHTRLYLLKYPLSPKNKLLTYGVWETLSIQTTSDIHYYLNFYTSFLHPLTIMIKLVYDVSGMK